MNRQRQKVVVYMAALLLVGAFNYVKVLGAEIKEEEFFIIPENFDILLNGSSDLSVKYEIYPVPSVDVELIPEAISVTTIDRSKPIYEIYKNGIKVEAPTEWQWYIHDKCVEYEFDEKIIMSMITTESTWHATSVGGNDFSFGLAQMTTFWADNKILREGGYYIAEYTGTNKAEWLKDPYHNIDTLIGIWRYARDVYHLDLSTDTGYVQLLYWHSTGKDPTKITEWKYADLVFGFRKEIITLQEL